MIDTAQGTSPPNRTPGSGKGSAAHPGAVNLCESYANRCAGGSAAIRGVNFKNGVPAFSSSAGD